jgi:quercetin dioxygenase-like cupin family protein
MNTILPAPASITTVSAESVTAPPPRSPLLTRAGQGRVIRAFGDEISLLMTGKETGGAYTAFICTTPPGGGPPPHRHEREDEWFYVLDGVVSFLIQDRWHDARPGDFVFAPRGSVHTFNNKTAQAARMLVHTSPSGFEDFFAEAEQVFNRPGGPDLALAVAIAAKHGIQIMAP